MNYDGMMRCDSSCEKFLRCMNFIIGRPSKGTARVVWVSAERHDGPIKSDDDLPPRRRYLLTFGNNPSLSGGNAHHSCGFSKPARVPM